MTKNLINYFFLSLFLHSLIFLFMFFTIRQSMSEINKITYVNILEETTVGPSYRSDSTKTLEENKKQIADQKELLTKSKKKSPSPSKEEEKILEERIAALKAKKRIIEKAKISISKVNAGNVPLSGIENNKEDEVSQNYLLLISGIIREKWNLPETVPKNLEAIVTIRILPNGQTIIEGFEKKSGNTLFDSSVIRAINYATPLPRPHKEILIGLRFKP